jgi:predicted DNA-binding protein
MIRARTVRMSDELWEAIAVLAERNSRTIAEEIRAGMEAWLKLAGNITITETRHTKSRHGNQRQRDRMARSIVWDKKKKEEK